MGIGKFPAICAFSNVSSWYQSEKYFTHVPTKYLEIPNSTVATAFSNVYSMEEKKCPVVLAMVTLPMVMTEELFHIYLNII